MPFPSDCPEKRSPQARRLKTTTVVQISNSRTPSSFIMRFHNDLRPQHAVRGEPTATLKPMMRLARKCLKSIAYAPYFKKCRNEPNPTSGQPPDPGASTSRNSRLH